MKLLYLELVGYKRVSLNSVTRIKYTPENKNQLILGTNGSGKSSLIHAITPLPASANDFENNGKKITRWSHRGESYELISEFNPQKHYFFKNGIELNLGHTVTAQKELVKQEFGITPDIHDLMIGQTNFHSMGPTERRSWFTRLSDTDFNYAISVFLKLKERQRDLTGSLNRLQSRSIQEANKLINEEQEKTLRDEIEKLRGLIDTLLNNKPAINKFMTDVDSEIKSIEDSYLRDFEMYRNCCRQFRNFEGFKSKDSIKKAIDENMFLSGSIESTISQLAKKIEDVDNFLKDIINTDMKTINDIDTRFSDITDQLESLHKCFRILPGCSIENPLALKGKLEAIQPMISDICTEIIEDPDFNITPATYKDLCDSILKDENDLKNLEHWQTTLIEKNKELIHLRDHDLLTCPKCDHKWYRGYKPDEHLVIEAQIKTNITEHERITQLLKVNHAKKIEFETYLKGLAAIGKILNMDKDLLPLNIYITDNEIIRKSPRKLTQVILDAINDCNYQHEIDLITKELSSLEKSRELLSKNSEASINNAKQQSEMLHHELYLTYQNQDDAKKKVIRYNEMLKLLDSFESFSIKTKDMMKNHEVLVKEKITILERDSINNLVSYLRGELVQREQQISQIDIQKGIVKDINDQIKITKEQEVMVGILAKSLSPTTGLIAKGMGNFINFFVTLANGFIRKVWLYPFELVPILPNEDNAVELDYNFSVLINDTHSVPDIKILSSGQQEIIDLAFRIIAMKCLDMQDYPLILDEFAKAMDEAHRRSAFNVISTLINQSDFSQIFIVSHYSDCYGSLKNADISVMCGGNISLPRDAVFNECMEFEYGTN